MEPLSLSETKEIIDELDFYSQQAMTFGFEVRVYFNGTLKENAAGVQAFYDKAVELGRKKFKYVAVNDNERFKKVKKDTFDMLPFWASDACEDPAYLLYLKGGKHKDSVNDWNFVYDEASGPTWLRLMVPAEEGANHYDTARALLTLAAEHLDLTSGYAGYGAVIQEDYDSDSSESNFHACRARFLGIEFLDPLPARALFKEHLSAVNWLTLINGAMVERAGGVEAVKGRLDHEGVQLFPLEKGLILQAGEAPTTGDVNRKADVSAYQAVGKALQPIGIPVTAAHVAKYRQGDPRYDFLYRFVQPGEDS
ncbi:type VI immunity family protein [Acanthopleuribacter pedis]|uniref:DUF3396 domain-containing protein n=1 Tax=Acanthopleuribacter pedis TaxID=442870 RepID=A0A8J7QJZ6_9BACT|nr:type VI immunity family protein [Acanthopleuribacter pedis]MBO1322316.1 DUF3396 domain-containing protein [Acanthopleuribacter pedis]